MKIKFIQETKINGDIIYYTMVDERFVPASLKLNRQDAQEIYNRIKENGGALNTTEVLESFDTEQTPY